MNLPILISTRLFQWSTLTLGKMTAQLKKMDTKLASQLAVWIAAAGTLAAVGGKFGSWTSFEVAQITCLSLLVISFMNLLHQMSFLKMMAGRIASSTAHSEFIFSCSGGNQVKQLMGIFDKISYIEYRLQFLTGEASDARRMISQAIQEGYMSAALEKSLEAQCKQWVGARLKFKDVDKMEFNAAWQQIWSKGLAYAEKLAEDWKANPTSVADCLEAEKMATKITMLKTSMPAKFNEILQY